MKKFKTIRNYNIKIIIIIFFLTIIFALQSFCKLNKSYDNIIKLFINDINKDNLSINRLVSNLDNLINTYEFNDIKKYNKSNKIYLYNDNPDAYYLLKNNLNKLGIEVIDNLDKNSKYNIMIKKNYNTKTININNKKYAKIYISDNKMNEYLNNRYPGISELINKENNNIVIEVNGNNEELNNSTEILAMMLYYMIGE